MAVATVQETLNLKDGTTTTLTRPEGLEEDQWSEIKAWLEDHPDEARWMRSFTRDSSRVREYLQTQYLEDYYQTKMEAGDEKVWKGIDGLPSNPEFAFIFQTIMRTKEGKKIAMRHAPNYPLMMRVNRHMGGLPEDVKKALSRIAKSPVNLQDACKLGDLKAVEEYVEATEASGTMDLDAPDARGVTCLGYAIGANRISIVKLLLEKKADPFKCDTRGGNGLHYAAAYGRQELINFLADGGVDVNSKDSQGNTPLALAAKNKQANAVSILKSKGGGI